MKNKSIRNVIISLFVFFWTLLFHYESIRYFYLQPLVKFELWYPKFLFPPAGWIMFFQVDDEFGYVEVYGVRNNTPQRIDPHEILATRTIGYDNIHRNILSRVSYRSQKPQFCRFLNRKFPEFENFLITAVHYPSLTERPQYRLQQVLYTCE